MIVLMIVTVLLVAIAGLLTLKHAVKNSAVGYEDEFGFHEGSDPQRSMILQTALEGIAPPIAKTESRERSIPKRAVRKSQRQGSAAPFHAS